MEYSTTPRCSAPRTDEFSDPHAQTSTDFPTQAHRTPQISDAHASHAQGYPVHVSRTKRPLGRIRPNTRPILTNFPTILSNPLHDNTTHPTHPSTIPQTRQHYPSRLVPHDNLNPNTTRQHRPRKSTRTTHPSPVTLLFFVGISSSAHHPRLSKPHSPLHHASLPHHMVKTHAIKPIPIATSVSFSTC
jgi:hypothetical protein